ncbi:hypothetical protein BC941DRAFT_515793, partial [Chlamydoabsidia padenii]
MIKSVYIFCLVVYWFSVICMGDDDPMAAENAALGIKCNDMSTSEYPDAKYLQQYVLTKNATVHLDEKGYFIVAYQSAAVVSRPSGKENTTTHAYLRVGIDAIMNHCKENDSKISGEYTPPNSKGIYKICLTGSEETDDC